MEMVQNVNPCLARSILQYKCLCVRTVCQHRVEDRRCHFQQSGVRYQEAVSELECRVSVATASAGAVKRKRSNGKAIAFHRVTRAN